MSLINDALKRARQQQKDRPGPPPAGLPLQPVENRGNGGSLLRVVYPVLLLMTLGLGSFFLWKWYESRGVSNRGPEVAVTRPVSPPPEPTPAPSSTSGLAQAPLAQAPLAQAPTVQTPVRPVVLVNTTLVTRSQGPRPGASASPGVEGQPTAAPASPLVAVAPAVVPTSPPPVGAQDAPLPAVVTPAVPAVPAAAAEAPKPREFKLQAIFFRLRNPTVLINDQTVGVGATVNGAKITKIERESVSLLVDGETRVLYLR